ATCPDSLQKGETNKSSISLQGKIYQNPQPSNQIVGFSFFHIKRRSSRVHLSTQRPSVQESAFL
ncbi:MAG: hypothetical protein ACYTFU_05315, partial [Planctomycetota bacterium]